MNKKIKFYKKLMKVYHLSYTHSRYRIRKKNNRRYFRLINTAIRKWGTVPIFE